LENNPNCVITYHSFINKLDVSLKQFSYPKDEPINVILEHPQTSTMLVRGILRDLINKNVVEQALSLNDQYLRFLLKDYGKFNLIKEIKPNIRLIRDGSIFGGLKSLEKKRIALQSWQTFYNYHGKGKNKRYLAKKVEGFTSTVKWLEYKKYKGFSHLKIAISYDFKKGIFSQRFISSLKKLFFKPLIHLKRIFVRI
jgi:hypothetical protein